jgi:hypothetical protein
MIILTVSVVHFPRSGVTVQLFMGIQTTGETPAIQCPVFQHRDAKMNRRDRQGETTCTRKMWTEGKKRVFLSLWVIKLVTYWLY